MLIEWLGSDGTRVTKDDAKIAIEGASGFARELRGQYGYIVPNVPVYLAHHAPRIQVSPPPGDGCVPLDPSNAWLVDGWVRQAAREFHVTVTSEYAAPDEDAPPDVREIHDALERQYLEDGPDAIY